MRKTTTSWWALSLALCVLTWCGLQSVWGEEASGPLRAMILFDTSGSMHHNDPQRLSRAAAQLFLDLARPMDTVGLAAFSDYGVPLIPLTPLASPATRQLFQSQLSALQFTGQTTDLAAALETGLASFPPATRGAGRDLVLLLTDGKLDLGRERRAEESAVLDRIRHSLLPQYAQRGIALYTIAFTEKADRVLLQEMAQATKGEFRFITQAAALHKAFGQLFILAHQAESLPLKQGALLVDTSIQETSLVISKEHPQDQVTLVTPYGVPLHAGSRRADVDWRSTPSYDFVRLKEPEAGVWRVTGPSDVEESVAIIGASSLSLQVELSPAYRQAGEPFVISAFLLERGQRVRDPGQMQRLALRAEVTAPQGETMTLPLEPQEDGTFAARLTTLHTPGRYNLVVTASAPTLQRQRTLSFVLHPLCFQPSVSSEAPVTASVVLTGACPLFRELVLEAGHTTGDGATTWLPFVSVQPKLFQVPIPAPPPGQTGQVTIRLRGALDSGEPFMFLKGPWPLPATPLPPPKTNGLLPLYAVLILVGGGELGFLVWRIRRVQRHRHATEPIAPAVSTSDVENQLHEINTSTQYTSDNLRFLYDAFGDLIPVLEGYATLLQAAKDGTVTEALLRQVESTAAKADVAYLIKDSPKAIQQALEGIEHIVEITRH